MCNQPAGKRTWGFRFSATDAIALLILGAAILGLYRVGSNLWWLVAIVAGHFFLFCNIFRVVRRRELIWSALFVLNVAFFAFSVFVAIMFFRHSWLFPRLYILQWILIAALPLIDAGWVAVTASAYSGESLSEYLTMDPKDIGQVIGAVIIGPIWIAYILRSRRVKNTFVK